MLCMVKYFVNLYQQVSGKFITHITGSKRKPSSWNQAQGLLSRTLLLHTRLERQRSAIKHTTPWGQPAVHQSPALPLSSHENCFSFLIYQQEIITAPVLVGLLWKSHEWLHVKPLTTLPGIQEVLKKHHPPLVSTSRGAEAVRPYMSSPRSCDFSQRNPASWWVFTIGRIWKKILNEYEKCKLYLEQEWP